MYKKLLPEIIEYFESKVPEEACGVIIVERGHPVWVPCENVAEDKLHHFVVNSLQYMKASLKGPIVAMVHSHPNGSAEPSEHDKEVACILGIPSYIIGLPSKELKIFLPRNHTYKLEGREYAFGINDCFTLVRDYYKSKLEIELPPFSGYPEEAWENGVDYTRFTRELGFYPVPSLKKHDVIAFNVLTNLPSHFGVYLGEDTFLHHARDRLSTSDSLNSFWGRFPRQYFRCKQLI